MNESVFNSDKYFIEYDNIRMQLSSNEQCKNMRFLRWIVDLNELVNKIKSFTLKI